MEYCQGILKKIERPERYTTILSAAITTVVATYFIRRAMKNTMKYKSLGTEEIPSPKGEWFFFGHLPLMGGRLGETVTKWHKELGPIFRVRVGNQNWVFVGDPLIAHDLLVTKGIDTAGRPKLTFLTEINSPGDRGVIHVNYSKKWKEARNAILQILSPKSVESLSHILEREAQKAVNIMIEKSKLDQEIDSHDLTSLASMNLMLSLEFGIPGAASVDEPLFNKMVRFTEQVFKFSSPQEDYSMIFPSLKFLDFIFKKEKRMIEFRDKEFHPFIREIIQLARESKEDSLVKKLDEIKNKHHLDEQSLVSLLSEILVVGTDTTAIATEWAITILCLYPEVQKKICEEVDAFIKKHGRQPMFSDREELPYLIAFEKESIRFRPPLDIGSPHTVLKDVAYKNYIIPKGHDIVINIHTLHNDPNVFLEPEKFMPERFLKDTRSMYASSNGNIQMRDHYAFGWGRRICPGIYLAESQIFHVITKILAVCTIEPALSPSGEKIYPNLDEFVDTGVVIAPAYTKIRLVERENKVISQ
ncbi:unnamed protein product [Rhizopus stolonifer]